MDWPAQVSEIPTLSWSSSCVAEVRQLIQIFTLKTKWYKCLKHTCNTHGLFCTLTWQGHKICSTLFFKYTKQYHLRFLKDYTMEHFIESLRCVIQSTLNCLCFVHVHPCEPTIFTPPQHPIKVRLKGIKFLFAHNLYSLQAMVLTLEPSMAELWNPPKAFIRIS